ncbi:threonine aldolase [Mycobacterium yunnanensis]|uniref:Threonine aldolase n=1 Tax=Mycobacterium yunnanensis TaxID=368477 RepID=A0A9X2Z7B9_9MYCO|nr:beta-eliminating lyase-related protein [Mycobacterium yunnanensis]MCV7423510.1 threonine aldolase [Mycobacterium yunnanensis]
MTYVLASDNWSGAHPEVLDALIAANAGEEMSYGRDRYTARLQDIIRSHFGPRAEAFPVFNGTGANVVALQSMQPSWGGVICASSAHVNTDEGGAPERVAGLKMLPAATTDGKLTPRHVRELARDFGNVHHAQPSVVSITQSTELGTLYTPDEIADIADLAHGYGMSVHLDGARLANAAAALDVPLSALTTDLGVDVVSLGGTKNGLLFGELVVVLDPARSVGIGYIRKYTMQLASKMRYISAQFIALLEGDLWLRGAHHANAQAALLRSLVEDVPGLTITQPTQANAVFAILPPAIDDAVRRIAEFQTWNSVTGEVRWMCSHETDDATVRGFAAALHELSAGLIAGC